MKREDIERANVIADSIFESENRNTARQIASTLFQRTLETKKKQKWLSSEDDAIRTFFYLSSKEELCEAFQCDMESLYKRARQLGVVSPSFQTLTSSDIVIATELFYEGKSQQQVLDLFGISSVTVPVKSLDINNFSAIRSASAFNDSSQMELFDDED